MGPVCIFSLSLIWFPSRKSNPFLIKDSNTERGIDQNDVNRFQLTVNLSGDINSASLRATGGGSVNEENARGRRQVVLISTIADRSLSS